MPRLGLWLVALGLLTPFPVAAQEVTRRDLKPGLVAGYTARPGRPATTTYRLEPTPAVALAAGESHHPAWDRLAAASWTGFLQVVTPGKYTFSATLVGAPASVVLHKGDRVLTALEHKESGADRPETVSGPALQLEAGFYRFQATYSPGRSATAARQFELQWEGPGFQREPVPSFAFGHLPKDRPARIAEDRERDHGRFLFEEMACKRCHVPAGDPVSKGLAERTGPDLTAVGARAYPGWLEAWLADPTKLRPHTVMPRLFADNERGRAERYAVVAYLTSLGGPVAESRRAGNFTDALRSIANGQKLYLTTGCAACHGDKLTQLPAAKLPDDPDAEVKPAAKPEDQFASVGTAGPRGLYLLGALGSKTTPEMLERYLRDPLAANPHGRMPDMALSRNDARDLARFLSRQTGDMIPPDMPAAPKLSPGQVIGAGAAIVERGQLAKLKPAEQWKAVGKRLLTAKGCVNCHTIAPGGKALPTSTTAPSLVRSEKPAGARGCLADAPDPTAAPVYKLDADQKTALAAFLRGGLKPSTPAPAYEARVALKRYNCLNCHSRDGEGGLPAELAERMRLLEKAENADDVAPPRLTGVGHKLRSSWLTHVLTGGGRARPWMTLRMPQFGKDNVGFLADALPKLEGTTADDSAGKSSLTAARVEAGRTLAGKDGFGCIACHDISGIPTGGTRGPDLATTRQRVRLDWYARWMHQPQRLTPGTRMPLYFTDGRSQYPAVLGGDADAQIAALWAYFSLGPGLPLPKGIEPPGKALVVAVKDRPEILRTFLPDAGTKAIAVGYPGGVSLAFDASTCRLGYAWTGNFLDAAPVWTNRGGSPAKLLGPKFWTAPPGFPWAVTDSRTPPDFLKRADDPAYGVQLPNDEFYGGPRRVHFSGYSLAPSGAPTFRYTLTDADGKTRLGVAETPTPLPVTVAAGLRRTFTLDLSADKTTWLLVGVAAKAPRVYADGRVTKLDRDERPAAGSRLVVPGDGDRATVVDLLKAPAGSAWHAAPRPDGGWVVMLRLPESDAAGKADVSLAVWGLPRDDEELIKGLKAK
ncbi:MAG TPA: c-type cytochrome [Fimbriiglobus sp.]|nr:c-type cytochrome [Fimbriiglobus sp.]